MLSDEEKAWLRLEVRKASPQAISPSDIVQRSLHVLEGDLHMDPNAELGRPLALLKWLHWSQSAKPEDQMKWVYAVSAGEKEVHDREDYVLRLWHSIVEVDKPNHCLVEYLERKVGSWKFYERHFFGWFLSRFNLSAARRMFDNSFLSRWLHIVFFLICLGAAVAGLWSGPDFRHSLEASALACMTVAGLFIFVRAPLYACVQSLVPRMGLAVGIGYLFLMSASHLIKAIAELGDRDAIYMSIILVVLTFLYIPIHVWRRVYPSPGKTVLLARSAEMLALGIAYAALGLLFFAPIFFSSALLEKSVCAVPPLQLILCASIALILGVILQLAWDEKPLTEPL